MSIKSAMKKVGKATKKAANTYKKVAKATNPVALSVTMAKKAGKLGAKASKAIGSVGQLGAQLAQTASPFLQFMPGGSAISSMSAQLPQLLSTLNDDSWFSKETGAGAAFNELVAARTYAQAGKPKFLEVQAGYVEIATYPNMSTAMKEEVMPTLLAYVRKKTNNVLIDDVDKYFTAFVATEQLFALYYTLRKYEHLAQHLPANLPTLPDFARILSPEVVNQFIGIADALESYLKSSTGLPYALASYIRWRYGSTFHSDNTGKPGLVSYNIPLVESEATVSTINDLVSSYLMDGQFVGIAPATLISNITYTVSVLKSLISASGRAAADFNFAYANNGVKFDVELPHYDEKEYNLRANLKLSDAFFDYTGAHQLIKDSRLEMNAAVQAITLSTPEEYQAGSDTTPFVIHDYTFGINLQDGVWFNGTVTDGDNTATSAEIDNAFYSNLNWRWISYGNIEDIDQSTDLPSFLTQEIVSAMITSLQCHNFSNFVSTGIVITAQPLSYDTALVSSNAIKAIHRLAIRNLTRGEFTRQDEENAKRERASKGIEQVTEKLVTPEVVESAQADIA